MGSIVTVGNFDGVHLGHQQLLATVLSLAKSLQLQPWVLTFEPQPLEFFLKDKAPARLSSATEKQQQLQQLGMTHVRTLAFDESFSKGSAQEFIQSILLESLGARVMVVGADFRFGHQRQGTVETLEKAGIRVQVCEPLLQNDRRVSSSWVREVLKQGDFAQASRLLGRPYTMQGVVVKGDQIGRTLGFPTANLQIDRLVSPLHGIYAVKVWGIKSYPMPAVASIGSRPAVGGKEWLLEVHILDEVVELYGRSITVEFCKKWREEENFANLAALTEQIRKDVEKTRDYFYDKRI